MKIKSIKLKNFKRFTDLTIKRLPETAKLVVMIGPNGCGKSSVFDAIQSYSRGISHIDNYYAKSSTSKRPNVEFYKSFNSNGLVRVRSAYRNDPTSEGTSKIKMTTMIQNDQSFSSNCNSLLNQWLNRSLGGQDSEKLGEIRDEIFGEIQHVMSKLFKNLKLDFNFIRKPKHRHSELFCFKKGVSQRLSYHNLSSGERACLDLILDIIIFTRKSNGSTLFCIDEPEAHIHTKLQGKLLEELYKLIPNSSQLWIATHSIGMVRKAQDLYRQHPESVVFLDFGKDNSGQDRDFDGQVTITLAKPNPNFWASTYKVALGDLAELVVTGRTVFCEGETFDEECYRNIFKSRYPEVCFVSLGSRGNVEKSVTAANLAIEKIAKSAKVIGIVDRDKATCGEIKRNAKKGIRTLSRQTIESYLLDDEVLTKLCEDHEEPDKVNDLLMAKRDALNKHGLKASDNLKPIVQQVHGAAQKALKSVYLGNTKESFMMDMLAPRIQSGMKVYEELHEDIFGE